MTDSTAPVRTGAAAAGQLDEALERLHRTGPEFEGFLSNHGPMVVEAMARRERVDAIHRWVDGYVPRLEALPTASEPIGGQRWQHAVGDPGRIGDWVAFFTSAVAERPWQQVLTQWWPRLLPGIAAGATHGVIRVGHATMALRSVDTAPRVAELAHALAYWAARWQPVPQPRPVGTEPVARLAPWMPRIADQTGGIVDRFARLATVPAWATHVSSLAPVPVAEVPAALDRMVDAVIQLYPSMAHGQPTMLVHAATAPNAVAAILPSVPRELWTAAHNTAWAASAAVLSSYLPARPAPVPEPDQRRAATMSAPEAFDQAVAHGSEHVVKLADSALRSYDRTADPRCLEAVLTAIRLGA